jgi:hypothetical protein
MRTAVIVWAVLVLATVVSFALGGEHLTDHRTAAAVAVIAIAVVKVRLVGLHFMELRDAPVLLRAAFEGYLITLFVVLTALYLAV